MGKQLFKQLLRSTTVSLACMAAFVFLFFGGTAFDKTGDIAPMNDMEPFSELYN